MQRSWPIRKKNVEMITATNHLGTKIEIALIITNAESDLNRRCCLNPFTQRLARMKPLIPLVVLTWKISIPIHRIDSTFL